MSDGHHSGAHRRRRLVVMGVSGCGKSEIGRRLAERLGYDYVEGDDYHPTENIAKMAAGIPLDDNDRQGWLLSLQRVLRTAADNNLGLVLSCSALKRRYRDILRLGDPELVFVHLCGERDLIQQRMRLRHGHFMPPKLIDSQFSDLEPLDTEESGFAVDIRLIPDALVDEAVRRLQQ